MIVPFFDRTRADAALEPELAVAYRRVMRSGRYIICAEVEALEREAAAYLGARYAIGVSSGTDALIVALLALGIGPGDQVIVPAYTFVATASAVVRVGARPVFVDARSDTLCMDLGATGDAVDRMRPPPTVSLIRAAIPVHLFGRSAQLPWDGRCCIEDAAQAFGTSGVGRGALACHSFYPTKNLGGFGDGGLVATDDGALAERARMLRAHGSRERYRHEEVGGNYRLDELQAALLRVKLRHIDEAIARRRAHAAAYEIALSRLGEHIETPPRGAPPDLLTNRAAHTFNQYVIRVRGDGARDRLRAHLAARGVGTEVYYPTPLHLQPCFAHLGYRAGDFPVAEAAARETLALPIFPELTSDEIAYVVKQIEAFFASSSYTST